MLVSAQWAKEARIIHLSGRLDKSARIALETAIFEAELVKCPRIILNLSNVSVIDSAGLGKLFLTYHHLKRKSIQLSLVRPKPHVRQMLDIVEMPALIPTLDNEEEVLTSNGMV